MEQTEGCLDRFDCWNFRQRDRLLGIAVVDGDHFDDQLSHSLFLLGFSTLCWS